MRKALTVRELPELGYNQDHFTENGSPAVLGIDEKRNALDVVLRSSTFARADQLRNFLRYVCEMEMAGRGSEINEYRVGVEALGRPATYSTGDDSAVRRRAHALREKLDEFYSTEAVDADIRIELPKGSYVPRFVTHERLNAPVPLPAPPEPIIFSPVETRPTPTRGPRWAILAAALLPLALCAGLWIQNRQLQDTLARSYTPPAAVAAFWRQMVGNGHPTYMVVADANLTLFQNTIKRHVTISEYQNHRLGPIADEQIADPALRTLAKDLVARRFTGIVGANVARKLGTLFAAEKLPLEIVTGRDLTIAQIATGNTILAGSRRANPWLELFEDSLNFQTVFTEDPRRASFVNRHPKTGEDPVYQDDWSTVAYCRVAFLPNPRGTGTAVLISGTAIVATESGGEFLTDEEHILMLRKALGVGRDDALPHFEALVRGHIVNGTISRYDLFAVRRH